MTDKIDIVRAARQLLELLYKMYCRDITVRRYGMYPWSLTERSGINFKDGGEALSVVYLMWRYGWIRIVSPKVTKKFTPFCRILLTLSGIQEAQSRFLQLRSKRPAWGNQAATAQKVHRDVVRDFHN